MSEILELLEFSRDFVAMAAHSQRNLLNKLSYPPKELKDGAHQLFQKLEQIDLVLAKHKKVGT